MVDLAELDYSRLDGAEAYLTELVTPFVLKSESPEASDRTIPWWWAENHDSLRLRQERFLNSVRPSGWRQSITGRL